MHRLRFAVLAFAAALAASASTPALAQPVASPAAADTFYDAPSDLAGLAPGAVIRSRPVSVPAYGIILPVQAWQLLYRSTSTNGDPIAATTTLIVPPSAPPGPRPLISYQVAINSLYSECNPSRTLVNGTLNEIFMLIWPLLRGWAVAVPDHEGPNNAYAAGRLSAHVVLDGARAVEGFAPAGLAGPATPLGLWGYSGGGLATGWTAELQSSYAPELNVVGSAEGGVPVDFNALVRATQGSDAFGLLFAAALGLAREYPGMDLQSLLNQQGLDLEATMSTECVSDELASGSGKTFDELTTKPDAVSSPGIQAAVQDNTLGISASSPPKMPILLYHSVADNLVPTQGATTLAAEYCAQHGTVDFQLFPDTDHVQVAVDAISTVLPYFDGRFAGAPPPTTC